MYETAKAFFLVAMLISPIFMGAYQSGKLRSPILVAYRIITFLVYTQPGSSLLGQIAECLDRNRASPWSISVT